MTGDGEFLNAHPILLDSTIYTLYRKVIYNMEENGAH